MKTFLQILRNEEIEEIRVGLKNIQMSVGVGSLHSGHLVSNRALFERIKTLMTDDDIEMSGLYADVVLLSSTPLSTASDMPDYLEIKTIIYEYLVHFSNMNSNLSLLCFNAFEKDLRSSDSVTRAMALRFYAQLKNADAKSRAFSACIAAISHDESYIIVESALMSIATILRANQALVPAACPLLRQLLLDGRDIRISAQAVAILNEFDNTDLRQETFVAIIDVIESFTPVQQVAALRYISRHSPGSLQDVVDVMNLLDGLFNSDDGWVFVETFMMFHLMLVKQHSAEHVAKQLVDSFIPRLMGFIRIDGHVRYFRALTYLTRQNLYAINHEDLVSIEKSAVVEESAVIFVSLVSESSVTFSKKMAHFLNIYGISENVSLCILDIFSKSIDANTEGEVLQFLTLIVAMNRISGPQLSRILGTYFSFKLIQDLCYSNKWFTCDFLTPMIVQVMKNPCVCDAATYMKLVQFVVQSGTHYADGIYFLEYLASNVPFADHNLNFCIIRASISNSSHEIGNHLYSTSANGTERQKRMLRRILQLIERGQTDRGRLIV